MLQRIGCRVTLTRSACEALQVLHRYNCDALLVDMDMVNGESWRVLRTLDTMHASIPVVALCSTGREERKALAVYGVHTILPKPVSRDGLLKGITGALESSGKTL
jgi:CheY-like chemotaxis protein